MSDPEVRLQLLLKPEKRNAHASGEACHAVQRLGMHLSGSGVATSLGSEYQLARCVRLVHYCREELQTVLRTVPNIVEEGAPAGGEEDYVVLETVGTPPTFDFEPKDHLGLGERLGAIDMERGAKVSGARFYFLTGVGAQLQMALLNLAMEQAIEAGFVPMIPPVLVKPESMEGTGFLGETAHPDEEVMQTLRVAQGSDQMG